MGACVSALVKQWRTQSIPATITVHAYRGPGPPAESNGIGTGFGVSDIRKAFPSGRSRPSPIRRHRGGRRASRRQGVRARERSVMSTGEPFWKTKRLEDVSLDGMGIAVRRLRQVLPAQAGGRGYRRGELHQCGLPPAGNLGTSGEIFAAMRSASAWCRDPLILTPRGRRRDEAGCPRPAPIAWSRTGENLAWWHPLVSGSPETVHEQGFRCGDVRFRNTTRRIDPTSGGLDIDMGRAKPLNAPRLLLRIDGRPSLCRYAAASAPPASSSVWT